MKDYDWAIRSNQIKNCPITVDNIKTAETIWGKDISALKGKTTRLKPIHIAGNPLKVPREFLQLNRNIYMTAEIFCVNGQPFFITLSRNIDFLAISHLGDRKIKSIFYAFKAIYRLYLQRVF